MTEPSPFESFLRLSVADGDASPRTLTAYRDAHDAFLAYCRSRNQDAATADTAFIVEYRRDMVERHLSRPTISLRLTVCRLLYRALQRSGLRADNPADGVKAPRATAAPADSIMRKCLSPDEALAFCSYLREIGATFQGARDRAMLTLMMMEGLRADEVGAILNTDLDPHELHWIDVRGKGNKHRRVVLTWESRASLMAYIDRAGRLEGPVFYRADAPIPATLSLGAAPKPLRLSVRSIERAADRHLSACGLKRRGRCAHALRHTAGVLARLGGAEREAIRRAFGHASARMTDLYIEAAAAYQEVPGHAAARFLDRLAKAKAGEDAGAPEVIPSVPNLPQTRPIGFLPLRTSPHVPEGVAVLVPSAGANGEAPRPPVIVDLRASKGPAVPQGDDGAEPAQGLA